MSELAETNDLELNISRTIAASRERVFNAWLEPQTLAQFMRPCDGEGMEARVENNPVKGGRFSIVMKLEDKEVPHKGTYLEVKPYSRLAFTWESPFSLDDSVVTIDFTEISRSVTHIALRQVKFTGESARDGHIKGWNRMFDNLTQLFG